MRRAVLVVGAAAVALLGGSVQAADAAPPGFVTASGTALELDGQPYRFTGINIYNANNLSGCWYPLGSGSTLSDSLNAIGGPKVIRAWFFQSLATTGGARDWSAMDNTLATAAAHGTNVIVTLGNQWVHCDGPGGGGGSFKDEAWYTGGYTQPDPAGTVSYRDWVSEVVTRYKDDPTILAWQLMNEAEVKPSEGSGSCSVNAPQILKDFAADVSGLVKSIDPNHLVSLGTIGGGQCGTQGAEYEFVHDLSTIDLCEYHDYGSPNAPMPGDQWNGLQVRVDQCNALGKPLFVGETGILRQETPSLQARANAFRAKFVAQFAAGIDGQLVWAWNKDGSVADHDIGPGDQTLAVLEQFENGPPASVITGATAPGANTIVVSGLGLDDVEWLSFWHYPSDPGDTLPLGGGSEIDVIRDAPNYNPNYEPGWVTVNEWSDTTISVMFRPDVLLDYYGTRWLLRVRSAGGVLYHTAPALFVPSGPADTTPPTAVISFPETAEHVISQGVGEGTSFDCSDETELASCEGRILETGETVLAPGGLVLVDAGVGKYTLVVTATDAAGNQATASVLFYVIDPDADGDGIGDPIDTGDGTFSDGQTAGTITARPANYTVLLSDLPGSDGIWVLVAGDGTDPVTIALTNEATGEPCGTVDLVPFSDVVLTCGSITVKVAPGSQPAEIVLSDDTSLFVDEGESATVAISEDGSFVIEEITGGDGSLELVVSGQSSPVDESSGTLSLYDFDGFGPPVANGGALNDAKAGSTIPLKWTLRDEAGDPVTELASASVSSQPVDCETRMPTGAPSAGDTDKLRHGGAGSYHLNWKTTKGWTGCRVMQLSLAGEGPITHDAYFRFR
jgi:hypothetical protein